MAGERILIVEDNVAREGRPLQIKVEKAGYRVVGIAETEDDAVEMASRERPTAVLMDIRLPNRDGQEDNLAGIRAARQILASTGAQIVFVTGFFEDDYPVPAFRQQQRCMESCGPCPYNHYFL